VNLAALNCKVVTDSTGAFYELPVLFSEEGAVLPVLRYQLVHSANSYSWHRNLVFAVQLLLGYAASNAHNFRTEEDLFLSFADRIRGGTLSPEYLDPSGLYWFPRRKKRGRMIIQQLSQFSKWHSKEFGSRPLNPLREGSRAEQILAFAAWCRRNNESFLGHLASKVEAAGQSHFTPNVGLDISSLAGQTGQLRFYVGPGFQSPSPNAFLDTILFSTQPIPEPSGFALAVIGTLTVGLSRLKLLKPR